MTFKIWTIMTQIISRLLESLSTKISQNYTPVPEK